MEIENQDVPEVLETPEEEMEITVEEPITEETPVEDTESSEDKIARLEKEKTDLESKNKQLFERAKKQEVKIPSKELKLSPKDYLALTESKISTEDFDEVTEFASFKKLSISEALKNPTLKTIIAERVDERKTAAATQIRGGARGGSKNSGEEILRKAESTGEVPDSDEGMKALVEARMARRIEKAKR